MNKRELKEMKAISESLLKIPATGGVMIADEYINRIIYLLFNGSKEIERQKSVIKEIRELIYENLFDKEEKYHCAISESTLNEVTDKMLQVLDKGDK